MSTQETAPGIESAASLEAVELDDPRLGGLLRDPLERGSVETAPREPGSLAIAATVPYIVSIKEGWGQP